MLKLIPTAGRVVAPRGMLARLHFQEFKRFIDQQGRPNEGFEETEDPGPKRRRMLDIVDKRADEAQTIDSAGNTATIHFSSPLSIDES